MGWEPSDIKCGTGVISDLYCNYGINPYLGILLFSTFVDYWAGIGIEKADLKNKRQLKWLCLLSSLLVNIGTLGFFKYTNFILGVINDLGILEITEFPKIVLPVGISFYTFQSMSYTIDIYFGKMSPRKSILDFALYVAFFPQLVAGPIVRAGVFFRDLDNRLKVDADSLRWGFCMILIGFTRKIVFADNLARVVDYTFANHALLNPIEIWTGALAFGWQIYFDFAGYTDIAIGVARIFGFQFDPNFNFPMSCRNIADHWTKWHISFSTWIRDYIYIPLGGSRVGPFRYCLNLFATWLFAGLWHGAAYHYVSWGLWQGFMLLCHKLYSSTSLPQFFEKKSQRFYLIWARIFTMFCLAFGFVMFRAENMTKALEMMKSLVFINEVTLYRYENYRFGILLIICYITSYYFSKRPIGKMISDKDWRFPLFVLVNTFMILLFGVTENQSFLYFQF